jgi:hypothetical protein
MTTNHKLDVLCDKSENVRASASPLHTHKNNCLCFFKSPGSLWSLKASSSGLLANIYKKLTSAAINSNMLLS